MSKTDDKEELIFSINQGIRKVLRDAGVPVHRFDLEIEHVAYFPGDDTKVSLSIDYSVFAPDQK